MKIFTMLQLPWTVLISIAVACRCDSFASDEVLALTSFKQAIYDDPLLVLSNWNSVDEKPCSWTGVTCSMALDHVINLNISGCKLRGFVPRELGQISHLRELILRGNDLKGTLPREIGMLKSLKILDLGMNQLSGPIPSEFGNLASITKINLDSNGLTGKLPSELGNLKYLEELRLDRNRLQGFVPARKNASFTTNAPGMCAPNENPAGLCRLTQLRKVDLSYNFFVGDIPKCLKYLPSSSFQGNCLQNSNIKQRPTVQCGKTHTHPRHNPQTRVGAKHKAALDGSKHKRTSKPAWLLALEIVTGTMVGVFLVIALLTALQKFKSKPSIIPWRKSATEKEHLQIYIDPDMLKDVTQFSRQELEVACEDFSNIIGSSPDNLVYKGTLDSGPEVAVISLCTKEEYWTDYLELYFQKEVADLARLNHGYVGKLLGFCRQSTPFARMLVFEYASNGTLYEHLHYGDACHLSWTRRMNIVIGIARGLKYLHTELVPPFTLCQLTSSAVYLTEDFSPKLVDFESWKAILVRLEKSPASVGNNRLNGSVLRNSLEGRHVDVEGNIYAFGLLLLEIVSGRPRYCKDKGSLMDWAKVFIEVPEAMESVVDPELKYFRYDDLKVICEVASLCTNPELGRQPEIQELCSKLESRLDTSVSSELKASSLAWAELALSS